MKKMFKTATVLAALLAMTNFIACSSGDDDNSEPSSGTGTESSTTGGDSSSSDSGSSSGSGSGSSGTDSGSSGSETATITASWNFSVASLTAAGLTTTAAKPSADKEIVVTSGSGATLTILAQTGKSLKIQSSESGGLNIGAGTSETEVLSITVDGACTLSFTGKGSSGSTFATTKPNSFSVAGNKVYTRAEASETSEQTWTYAISAAGTYKIAASGMIFTALTCK